MELRRWSAIFLLLWPVQGTPGGQGALPGHSISSHPDINHLAKMWHLTGTVIPSHDSLILNPGVAYRVGTIFSRFPLQTNDFEATFTFSAKSQAPGQFENEGFAFWYSEDNASAILSDPTDKYVHNQNEMIDGTWHNNYAKAGLDLLGFKNEYRGFGIFFVSGKDAAVSAKVNDGSLNPQVGNGIPDKNQLKFDYQNGEDHLVKVRVKPEAVEITVGSAGSLQLATKTKTGGYIGFSCWGGAKATYNPAKERSSVLQLKGLSVVNLGDGKGEEDVQVPANDAAPTGEQKAEMLMEHSSFKEHRQQSSAIKGLTSMIFKLMLEEKPVRESMTKNLAALNARVTAAEHSFEMLKSEMNKQTGHKLSEEFETLKKDLIDIHSVAAKHNTDRGKELERLHVDIQHVNKAASSKSDVNVFIDKLDEANSKVIKQLNAESQSTFSVSIIAIAFIIIAGLSLYNKFRCWEKKHVL